MAEGRGPESKSHNYTPEKLQRLLADCINHRTPLKDIKLVIRAGGDPNAVVVKGLRPIHYAVYENYVEAIEFLIGFGVEVNQADENGFTPLHHAAKLGHVRCCELLLEAGALVNYTGGGIGLGVSQALNELSINPLTLAIEHEHSAIVELLLKHGANPNAKYFLGYEINLIAAENTDCLALLLKYGADPDCVHRGGLTALMRCCKIQSVEGVKLLLESGANVNKQCPPPFDRRTALHFAAMSGNSEVCSMLLKAGADTSRPEDYEYSALEFSITQNKLEVCTLLLEHGANPNEQNAEGCSPLQVACTATHNSNQREIISVLLSHGADPRFVSRFYSTVGASLTPLIEYLAFQDEYDISIIRLLLEYGAPVNMTIATKRFRIKDGAGLLSYVHKLRPYGDVMQLLLEACSTFELEAIVKTSSLSNGQRELLLHAAMQPRTLRHLCRLEIRKRLDIPVKPKIELLQIPPLLKSYLIFGTKLLTIF